MEDIKILVVDDEARMRKLVKDFLSIKGYIVLEAQDGEEALKVFDANKDVKLILLDVMMPKMDGFEVLEAIRQYSKVPVMMLTARSEERDELEGYKLGVDEYITKPFSPKILVARVEAVLRRTVGEAEDRLIAGAIESLYSHLAHPFLHEVFLHEYQWFWRHRNSHSSIRSLEFFLLTVQYPCFQ